MALDFRPATPEDYPAVERLAIDSFAPITWYRRVDACFGPLNGLDWRERWRLRMATIFETQIVLVGENRGRMVAFACGAVDPDTRLGFIDLIGVRPRSQHKGYGRQMLRAMLAHLKQQGAVHAHLECLVENEAGNCLYRSEGFEEVARSVRWFVKIP